MYAYDAEARARLCPTGREGGVLMAGIDEAGRGPMAGPVVASAVVLPEGARIKGLRDSKLVPEPERHRIFRAIMALALDVGVGLGDVDDIERLNILGATKLAMRRALGELRNPPHAVLIDAVALPDVPLPQENPTKGDARSASIAAASIVAKVVRDEIMIQYHRQWPEYGFNRHKGYGSADHMRLIRELGPCPIHRQSFRGVKNLDLPF